MKIIKLTIMLCLTISSISHAQEFDIQLKNWNRTPMMF